MSEELEYYSKHDFSMYAGEWIALKDGKLLAHGKELEIVVAEANSKTMNPFFIQVPSREICID